MPQAAQLGSVRTLSGGAIKNACRHFSTVFLMPQAAQLGSPVHLIRRPFPRKGGKGKTSAGMSFKRQYTGFAGKRLPEFAPLFSPLCPGIRIPGFDGFIISHSGRLAIAPSGLIDKTARLRQSKRAVFDTVKPLSHDGSGYENSDSAGNLTRTQATGAGIDTLRRTVHHCLDTADVGLPGTIERLWEWET